MSVKIVDLQYHNTLYNKYNDIGELVSRLKYPQKYIRLEYEGKLYNLEIAHVNDNEFVLKIE